MTRQVLKSICLEDEHVKLEPMNTTHAQALYHAGRYQSIWRWTTQAYCLDLESSKAWVTESLEMQKNGSLLPFVIFDKYSNKVVGSSSYLNISLAHKAIEIGYSFLTPQAQKTNVNRRCKILLLEHAFCQLNMNRVAFQTHEKNVASRKAIEGLGATYEGTHRDCRIMHDGSVRSSAFYSIIRPEWPKLKVQLQEKIARHALVELP